MVKSVYFAYLYEKVLMDFNSVNQVNVLTSSIFIIMMTARDEIWTKQVAFYMYKLFGSNGKRVAPLSMLTIY